MNCYEIVLKGRIHYIKKYVLAKTITEAMEKVNQYICMGRPYTIDDVKDVRYVGEGFC